MTLLPWWRSPVLAFALDVLCVLVFAAVGRASHDESGPVVGALATAWPFLVGTAVGWLVVLVMRRRSPLDVAPGVTVWVATVLIGMVLRRATGVGTATSFVVVASVVLGLLLLGWRALGAYAVRRRDAAGAA